MIFKSLFKPKWKNKNPLVRRQALREMDPSNAENQLIFQDILKNDTDPVVRQTVLRHISDLSLLSELVKSDSDATVREHAVQRLRRLLTGNENDCPNVEERLVFLKTVDDTKLLEFIARQAKETELREALMMHIDRDSLYGDIALQDADPDLRFKAVGLVTQRNTLERVLKGSRTKDKRVRLAAQERLAEIKAHEERPEQLKQHGRQLCARLDSLAIALKAEPDSIRLRSQRQELDKEWAGVIEAWASEFASLFDEKISERYQRASESADQLLKGYAEQAERQAERERAFGPVRLEKERIYNALNDLLRQVEAQETAGAEILNEITDALSQIEAQWWASGELPEEEMRKTDQAFKEIANKLNRRTEDIKRYIKAVGICQKMISRAGAEDARAHADKTLQTLEKLWQSLERPYVLKLPDELLNQAQTLLEQLRAAKQKSEQQREKALLAFRQNLNALEKSLAEGKSKQASSLMRQLNHNIKALHHNDIKSLRDTGEYARYQAATGQLNELRDWQGWAAHPIRGELRHEVEALAEEIETCGHSPAYDYHGASKKIQRARNRWKSLGPVEGENGEALWERFNEACNRAYEPCQKFFDQEAEIREQNLMAKQALCTELEAYFAAKIEDKDEAAIDWKQLDRTIAVSLQELKKIGPVRRQAHADVRERFNTIIQRLKDALKAERDRNQELKEQLILNAEKVASALAESAKSQQILRDSSAAIKLVQANWKEIGYATDERKLWTRFRAACDSVFNERQAQFDFMAEERRAHLKQKETLCELIERLAELTGEELKNARSRINEIKVEWKEIGEVPFDTIKTIDARFEKACQSYEHARNKHAHNEKAAERQSLYIRHELCVQLDVLTDELLSQQMKADEASIQLERIKKAWDTLGAINPDDRTAVALNERYQRGRACLSRIVARDGQEDAGAVASLRTAQQQNLQNKLEWCLGLEILAGVESPAEYEQDRMAVQVQMLAHKLGHDVDAAMHQTESITEFENNWFTTGSPPALETVQLERRFLQARRALLASRNDTYLNQGEVATRSASG